MFEVYEKNIRIILRFHVSLKVHNKYIKNFAGMYKTKGLKYFPKF